MARALWPSESPIGRCVQIGGTAFPCWTVIGVAADPRRWSLAGEEDAYQYWVPAEALQSDALRPTSLLVRMNEPAAGAAVRRELLGLDPRIRFVEVESFREVMEPYLRPWNLGGTLFAAFGLLAVFLAALGLYSVIAFDVTQRTREIGIRTALGATTRAVVRVVLVRALRLAALGVALGLLAAVLLTPKVEDLLFGVPARDPVTFTTVAAVLLLVALSAAVLPARRASAVDPMVALRTE
jgi:putative ABC transport system permease protein